MNLKLAIDAASTICGLCATILMPVLFAACSDSDGEVIPTGQFDDGGYEIFGPSQESLGLIFAHKGTVVADYSRSYEIWALDDAYCSSDEAKKLNETGAPKCTYQPLTFKYVGKTNFDDWKKAVNEKKYNNGRYYRATYRTRAAAQGLGGCETKSCTFDSNTGWSTRVSMFPANKVLSKTGSTLPTVVIRDVSDPKGTAVTETWFMKAFFNADLGDIGFTFSDAPDITGSMSPIDCAACTAAIQVDVHYTPCTQQPTDESDMGCIEKK